MDGLEFWNKAEFVDPQELGCHNRCCLKYMPRNTCCSKDNSKVKRLERMFEVGSN